MKCFLEISGTMVDTLATGAVTAAYEKYINKEDTQDAIKLGAVMGGAHFVTKKALNHFGMTRPGAEILGSCLLYTYVAPKVVETRTDDMTVRFLASVGGSVGGGAVNRMTQRFYGHAASGSDVGNAYDVSTYSGSLASV